jgi:hypothetical protein
VPHRNAMSALPQPRSDFSRSSPRERVMIRRRGKVLSATRDSGRSGTRCRPRDALVWLLAATRAAGCRPRGRVSRRRSARRRAGRRGRSWMRRDEQHQHGCRPFGTVWRVLHYAGLRERERLHELRVGAAVRTSLRRRRYGGMRSHRVRRRLRLQERGRERVLLSATPLSGAATYVRGLAGRVSSRRVRHPIPGSCGMPLTPRAGATVS